MSDKQTKGIGKIHGDVPAADPDEKAVSFGTKPHQGKQDVQQPTLAKLLKDKDESN